MFREYSFVHVTSHNRASFVRLFWKCYRQIGKKGGKYQNFVKLFLWLLKHKNYFREDTKRRTKTIISIKKYRQNMA